MDGAQRQLFYLVKGLDRARYEPLVLLDADDRKGEGGGLFRELKGAGVDVRVVSMRHWRRAPEAYFRYIDALRVTWLARRARVRLVHASDLWKSGYARFIAWRLGIPSVIHVRGPITAHDVRKHGLGRATGLIPIARRYREELLQAGMGAARVFEIDDAVDGKRFCADVAGRATLRAAWGMGSRMAIGMVGRIEPFKRVAEFVEAVACLPAETLQQIVVVLIGEAGPAPYVAKVRELVRQCGLQERIIFTGRQEQMAAALSALDLLVTFSGGSVMFEAMAVGIPVVSVRRDGRYSVHTRHNETGWCMTHTDPRAIAGELQRVIEDEPLRRRLGAAGKAWVGEHLSVESMVEKTRAVYEKLLS